MEEMKKKGNVIALLPIGVFLAMYLGLGILFEYILDKAGAYGKRSRR